MVPHLLQPARHILIGLQLADIIHQQSSHGTAVIRRRYGPIALLTCRIPDLGFDGFRVNLDGACGKFDADGGLAVQIEFVTGEAAEKVGLADARIANENNCLTGKQF